MKWIFTANPKEAVELAKILSVPPVVASILISRGLADPEKALAFLNPSLQQIPSPFFMKDLDVAVARLIKAVRQNEKIIVYGDYDVDGTSATSLLILFFKEIGYPIDFYIPHRLEEGYSLNEEALRKLKARGAAVVITVDNGIAANQQADQAREMGLDLIITDHHEIPPELPQALAILNPLRKDCSYPDKGICGSGVAFNLLMGLRQRLREEGYFAGRAEPNLRRYLDLVALATVADMVPLTGVNRVFVKMGLDEMRQNPRIGIKALMDVAAVGRDINASHLGFRLGPRVNACGRLYDAAMGVKLLTSSDEKEAMELARQLDSANKERQVLEEEIVREALLRLESDPETHSRMSHVLFDEKWHPGVVGIVASRLSQRFYRPVVVLGPDQKEAQFGQAQFGQAQLGQAMKGSARSYGGLHLVEALRSCDSFLIKCGGHKAAAGLSLKLDQFESFRDAFEMTVKTRLKPEDCLPSLKIDGELKKEDIHFDFLKILNKLAPFGLGNPEPNFCLKGMLPKEAKVVGQKHLRLTVSDGNGFSVGGISFGRAEFQQKLPSPFNVAFVLEENNFNGRTSLQLNIKDWQKTDSPL